MMVRATSVMAIAATWIGVALLGACGEGVGTDGQAPQTPIVASGRVTGFGSLYANGTRYSIDGGTAIEVNHQAADVAALRQGMVVKIQGTRDASRSNGVAQRLVYASDITGPLLTSPTLDPDGTTLRMQILGTEIRADKYATTFAHDSDPQFGFGSLPVPNDILEVSGYRDGAGTLHASYLRWRGLHDPATPGATAVRIRGRILTAQSGGITLDNGIDVSTANTAFGPGFNLNPGASIDVEGTFLAGGNIDAGFLRKDDRTLPSAADAVHLEGIVSNYQGLGAFTLDGQPVDAATDAAAVYPLSLKVANGATLEVSGRISNGTLIADQVAAYEGPIRIESRVASRAGNRLTVQITPTRDLDVYTDQRTRFEDGLDRVGQGFAIGDINTGDFVVIEAYEDDPGNLAGMIVARGIRRSAPGTQIVFRGPVTASNLPSAGQIDIDLLNIRFTNAAGASLQEDDVNVPAQDFFTALQGAGTPVVRVKDTVIGDWVGDGVAEEMEIEH